MLVPAVLVGLAAFASTVLAGMGARGKLPRQHWAGIRTRTTMRSDAAWRAAHVAAAPRLYIGARIGLVFEAASVALAIDHEHAASVGFFVAGTVVWLLGALLAVPAANRAARAASD